MDRMRIMFARNDLLKRGGGGGGDKKTERGAPASAEALNLC